MSESNPNRRWFRFSLRTLFVLVTVLCVWLGFKVNSAHRQKEAVAMLRNAGAEIAYDYQMVPVPPPAPPMVLMHPGGKMFDPNQLPPSPPWLRKFLGDEYFHAVVGVKLSPAQPGIKKSDLDALGKLPEVCRFSLTGTGPSIGDKDLTVLGQLPKLEELHLDNAHIDGSCLALLPAPGRLTALSLAGTDTDDATLEQVERMPMLNYLYLSRTRITDAGLARLHNLQSLEILELDGTNITDAGLEHLPDSKKLYLLNLDNTQVSEAGLNKLWAVLPGHVTIQFGGRSRRPPIPRHW